MEDNYDVKEGSLAKDVKECNYLNNYEINLNKDESKNFELEKNNLNLKLQNINNKKMKIDYFRDQEDLLECNQIKEFNNLNDLNINHNSSNIKLYSISDNNTNSVKNSFKIGVSNNNNNNFNYHFKDMSKIQDKNNHDNNNTANIDKTNTEIGNNSNIIGNLNLYINDNISQNINTNIQPKNHKLSNENVLFDKYCEKNLITGASIGDSFYIRKSTSFNANNVKVDKVFSNIKDNKEILINKNININNTYDNNKTKLKKEPKEMTKLTDFNSKAMKTSIDKNKDNNIKTLRPQTSINNALSRNSNAFLLSNASNKSKGKTSIRDKTLISEELRKMKDEINRTVDIPSKSIITSKVKSQKHSLKYDLKNEVSKKYNFSGLYKTHLKQVLTDNLNKNIKKLTCKTNDKPMILNYDPEGYPIDNTIKLHHKETLLHNIKDRGIQSNNTKNDISKQNLI